VAKTEKNNDDWTGPIENKIFKDIVFNELTIRKSKITNSTFSNCNFKNCYLGFDVQYLNCEFNKCKFDGKYSSLGRPAEYNNCKFIECQFVGSNLLEGVDFFSCTISGKIKNVILKDEHPKIENCRTTFKQCDLSTVIFDNVSIYGHQIFKDTLLPTTGIRSFDNVNDVLIKRAVQICSYIKDNSKIESEVIFRPTLRSGQDLIILDIPLINSLFADQSSKDLFEKIVDGYELKDKKISS